jgi:hypothetical protein
MALGIDHTLKWSSITLAKKSITKPIILLQGFLVDINILTPV